VYIDKNYGQIFIFWDKWFGTYQEELKDVTPVYGITRPVHTWNPIKINFQHVWLLIKDAWRTSNRKDKLRIWLMPTGWRPADVAEKYPVYKITDVYHFEKYDTKSSAAMNVWCWIQLTIMLLLISYLFGNIAGINKLDSSNIYIYSAFIFLSVYAYTELMDRNLYAIVWEILKGIAGITIIYLQGDWFGTASFAPWISYVLAGYFIVSIIITALFAIQQKKEDKPQTLIA
jgi:hypothetical protein